MTRAKEIHADSEASAAGQRILTVSLHRARRGRAVAIAAAEPAPALPPRPLPSRAARMLALAHELQRLIDSGEIHDRAALAAQVGFTRARVTQIMDLLLLAPDIQEEVLFSRRDGPRTHAITERALRSVARHPAWAEQLVGAARLAAVDPPS